MLNIAIVEDDKKEMKKLSEILNRYSAEYEEPFHIAEFSNAVEFLQQFHADYQIIFMDINMPYKNGLDAAKELRSRDSSSVLIFITNMTQYAVRGYEVNALDYVIKPIHYRSFVLKMKRAVQQAHSLTSQNHVINTKNGLVKLSLHEIHYIEVSEHRIIYHTDQGEIQTYGTMKEVVQKLNHPSFALCNSCYYVNMRYVTAVENYTVKLGNTELQISHPKKKAFLNALNTYLGGSSI